MSAVVKPSVREAWDPAGATRPMLGPERERRLLEQLAECRQTLAQALARARGRDFAEPNPDSRAQSELIARAYRDRGAADGALEAAFDRYFGLRAELTLANMRLVAHVAKRYRDRGVAYADLIQEGFCGLLDSIDRFDLSHRTKLSTYATWWIRRAVQTAVAGGAYPVRLTPRHLRELARDQSESDPTAPRQGVRPRARSTTVQRIQSATRPSVSLDEVRLGPRRDAGEPTGDRAGDPRELDEVVDKWMVSLRPRERQVLSYRFGLGGGPRLSLSQVGKVLDVSKERVRQIQEAALKVLRTNASSDRSIEIP
jgi:RNA polymerase primary sigma factor